MSNEEDLNYIQCKLPCLLRKVQKENLEFIDWLSKKYPDIWKEYHIIGK